ncbi:hypothetical protein BBJ28_00009728 [Nothophytophthora sp. Chile5]|nr:hypothetical protein BBJ28_00009728 [Nothophytophthora sp. Chile5]
MLHMRALKPEWEEAPISMDLVREIAATDPTPMSLRQMRTFADGDMKLHVLSAKFLHKELQSRFARCNDDWLFTQKLRKAKARGSNLVPLICYGLQELKATDLGSSALQLESVQEDIKNRLDMFFLGRIGIRMLIGHHVESLEHTGGRVHLVNAEQIVREACDRARRLCVQYCGVAPPVEIRATANAATPFMYVESHLHHMVFELVKNSMRATVEHHQCLAQKTRGKVNRFQRVMNPNSPSLGFYIPSVRTTFVEDVSGVTIYPDVSKYRMGGELPPVQIVICQGSEDLTVKVSDDGGGVARSRWNKLWHYDYTTSAPSPAIESNNYNSFRQHFSGGGYGLPIARLFARYFGGEVTFSSLEGSGSTAFIQAHRLGTNMEAVPLQRQMDVATLSPPPVWQLRRVAYAA